MHNEVVTLARCRVRIPEICAVNNIAQRLKSGFSSHLKPRLRCAYHHYSAEFLKHKATHIISSKE